MTAAGLDLPRWLQPAPRTACFDDPDHFVWCGTLTQAPDGLYCLLYARWKKSWGFAAWVTHSEICVATAALPTGPFQHQAVILPARGAQFWDGLCTHNPTVQRFGGRYYLYYMGNTGDGLATAPELNWTHRNNQRVGVAWADHPLGPWHRSDHPLIEPTPGFHDSLCCSNPSIVERPEGGYLLIYKAVAAERPLPFGGPVVHVVARADHPLGPFTKLSQPIFVCAGVDFPAEDPAVFRFAGAYWAIVKDMAGYFTGAGKSLALFHSPDGLAWAPAPHCLVSTTQIRWADGLTQEVFSLERPQVYLDAHGTPAVLLCAAQDPGQTTSFNVQIPLQA